MLFLKRPILRARCAHHVGHDPAFSRRKLSGLLNTAAIFARYFVAQWH
jgi:hypothetical protein